MFTISIIGRPNVGKSTLFNRLIGKRHALVDDLPGVTRDRREGFGKLSNVEFRLYDTAGLEESKSDKLESRMMQQTEFAIDDSDMCFMVVDGRVGITPADQFFAKWLRKKNKDVILLINKCEGYQGDEGAKEAVIKLGFKQNVMISAEHNEGMVDLAEAIIPYFEKYKKEYEDINININEQSEEEDKFLQIAIVGRPNTGKSTLINKILGENRLLTGPEAGITRDSIAIDWEYEGKNIKLIDTAGIRRKANVTRKLEKLSVADSLRSLRFAHIGVLMIDATQAFEKQDLMVAERIISEGRAAVVVVNKWDLIKQDQQKAVLKELNYQLEELIPKLRGAKIITLSALEGVNINSMLKECFKAYKTWNKRITTTKLNNWLKAAEAKHLPPLGKNKRRIKLKYITQGNIRPPTFTLFSNLPKDLPDSYRRYLVNDLRDSFGIHGVPVRLMLRKSDNPYQS